jgi:hypothetical protein
VGKESEMNLAPASAGPHSPTFSPEQGEEVFLCLEFDLERSIIGSAAEWTLAADDQLLIAGH